MWSTQKFLTDFEIDDICVSECYVASVCLSEHENERYFLTQRTHPKKKHIHHERSTHTDDDDDDSGDEFFERGSFSSRSRSRSGTKEAETPARGNIMPL